MSKNEWLLSSDEVTHFHLLKQNSIKEGRPMVLWGWKRDKIEKGVRQNESRTIYFSADLEEKGGEVKISRGYFFLGSRAKKEEIMLLKKQVGSSRTIGDYKMNVSVSEDPNIKGYFRFAMEVGNPNEYDKQSVKRRLKGQPRLSIPKPKLVASSQNYDISKYAPFAVCVGSGLSAESGLPLLGSIHNLFEVDNMETGELVFGTQDNVPSRLVHDANQEFRNFCQFTLDAVKAKPSMSHLAISRLFKKGIIKEVFTDNMDGILDKVGVPYTKTRLSIFPDRYPVKFDPTVKALLIVGVAVDRRQVIKQARKAGLKIISINPVFGVAPYSRNMDYLTRGDIFFREKAFEALPKIIKESGFGRSEEEALDRDDSLSVAYGI